MTLLSRWHPKRDLDTIRQQFDHLWDDLAYERDFPFMSKMTGRDWVPAIELKENDTDIVLKAEIPGIDPKELNVEVGQDAVSISGEHREESKTEEKGIYRSEFRYGQFQRTVPLPMGVKNDQVKAEFKDGILTLTMPKEEGSQRKVVKVDLGGS